MLIVEYITSIAVAITFVTEKGFCSSQGEIRYENQFRFDDFVQKTAENSEKYSFRLKNLQKIVKLIST